MKKVLLVIIATALLVACDQFSKEDQSSSSLHESEVIVA